jgi:hypothetical protein
MAMGFQDGSRGIPLVMIRCAAPKDTSRDDDTAPSRSYQEPGGRLSEPSAPITGQPAALRYINGHFCCIFMQQRVTERHQRNSDVWPVDRSLYEPFYRLNLPLEFLRAIHD